MVLAGITYKDKDIDFTNVLCDLEDMGFDVMGMMSDTNQLKRHVFSFCRAIVSVYTGEKDLTKCGEILSKHMSMGGNLNDIINTFTESMQRSGFGKAEPPVTPQDHKKKAPKKAEEE